MTQPTTLGRVVRDGNVAVIYSPGSGASGWYSWNRDPEMIFAPGLVAAVERQDVDAIEFEARRLKAPVYTGAAHRLQLAWVPEGTRFNIVDRGQGDETVDINPAGELVA